MPGEIKKVSPLRVGIVGVGGIGNHHLRAYRELADVKVVAAADTAEAQLSKMGERYQIAALYQDYRELLANEELDFVDICTPNSLHAPVAIAALEQGNHVLCEKPLARSTAEAEQMVAAASKNNRALKVVFNHRRRGDVVALKKYISAGELGRIYHAKAKWLRRNGIPGLGSWFTKKELAGGGPLIDLGVHMLDMALHLLAEPRALTVSAATYAELGPRGRGDWGKKKLPRSPGYEVEDLASAFIRLEGDITLLLETSWATYRPAGDEFGIILYGTEGGAEIKVTNYAQEGTLRIYTDLAGVPSDIFPHVSKGDGHAAVITDFVTLLRSGDWSAQVGREGLERTRIIEACYRSAESGREIELDG